MATMMVRNWRNPQSPSRRAATSTGIRILQQRLDSLCRETAIFSVVDLNVDLGVDLDLDVVTASAGMNRVFRSSHWQELLSPKTDYLQVEVRVHVLE